MYLANEANAQSYAVLDTLERLRALNNDNDEVNVLGVVVVGAQGARKSSVLEAVGNVNLNITTRVPLVMSLQADQGAEPHALIGVSPDQTFFKKIDIAAVGNEIQALTSKLAGDGGAISEKPIYLKVMQKSGPTLTLIDLPGIMHNSANEGQTDILSATVSLVSKFVKNTEMVILMVVQAMDKFANAEVIKIAKEYDPDGNRTLGVVTKIDHIQPGCGIKSKLRMEAGHVQLTLGFIAVKNRSPIEVKNGTSTERSA